MKWTWKQVCALLFAVMVSESAYIVKASSQDDSFIPEVAYYGETQNVAVELTATKDLYAFQNAVHAHAPSLDMKQNGDVFVWGNIKYNPEDMNGNTKIEIGDRKATMDTIVLTDQATNEVFFYVDGTDTLTINGITHCTVWNGEDEIHVDMYKVQNEKSSRPRLHEDFTPATR